MHCPVDQTVLTMADRQGIEIDYCPTCRGVWLDRGELDKLIERSAPEPAVTSGRYAGRDRDHGRGGHDGGDRDGRSRKKSSKLSELFDFG